MLRRLPLPIRAYSPPTALTRFMTTLATAFMPFSPSPPALALHQARQEFTVRISHKSPRFLLLSGNEIAASRFHFILCAGGERASARSAADALSERKSDSQTVRSSASCKAVASWSGQEVGAHAAADPLHAFNGIPYPHTLQQAGDALQVAVAAAQNIHMLDGAVFTSTVICREQTPWGV